MKKNTSNKFGLSEETIHLLESALSKFPQIQEVKIFGSRAMGTYRPGSDIDLAIFSDDLSHLDWLDLLDGIEDLNLLYEIDCLYYNKIDTPALKEHIDQVGKVFYKANKA
ncbi:nucleotidyltransferase domain-containing protein [Zunongwangia sp. H14]|uniref:nucleotidyltransferase domain-containing protein n=1 Tax=Zunongwangia sp. H14 TaxID=3240792 RepID=UPI003563B124